MFFFIIVLLGPGIHREDWSFMHDARAKICEQWYLTLVAHRDNRPHYERDSVDLILSSSFKSTEADYCEMGVTKHRTGRTVRTGPKYSDILH